VGVIIVLGIFVFFGFGAGLICHLVGFAYPLYASLRSIETEGSREDTQWLTYWVVYGLFGLLEEFIDLLLFWIPFYYPLKLAFLLWCMLPQFKGASFLYEHIIKDSFKKQEDYIDAALSNINDKAAHVLDAAGRVTAAATSTIPSETHK